MPRPGFGVTSLVVGALVAFGALARLVRPFIPPPPPNALAGSSEPFLAQGGNLPVEWSPMSPAVVARARREDRPILLVIGTPYSRLARSVDSAFFSDPEYGRFVSRRFVCARVDGSERPAWLNAFLPYGRLREETLPGYMIVVLSPRGRLLRVLTRSGDDPDFDREGLMRVFLRAFAPDADRLSPQGSQAIDREIAGGAATAAAPNGTGYLAVLASRVPPEGGFATGQTRPTLPLAWRYLASVGATDPLSASLGRALASPVRDVLDGGFFRLTVRRGDVFWTEFGRPSVLEAELATGLAVAAVALNRREVRVAAIEAFDAAAAMTLDERVLTCEVGGERPDGRSDRHSFPPARLRAILDADDRAYAEKRLGLDVRRNPQCVPYPATAELPLTDGAAYASVVAGLRANRPQEIDGAGKGVLWVEARVVARLQEAARLLGVPRLTARAAELRARLDDFRRPDAWAPKIPEDGRAPALTDRLAVVDALLQEFLSTGRVAAYEEARDRFDMALRRFAGDEPGAFRMVARDDEKGLSDLALPEISDNTGEAATAVLIRVGLDLARLEGDTPAGRRFRRAAEAAVARFAGLRFRSPLYLAGYQIAAAGAGDDLHAVVVGADAVGTAAALARAAPWRGSYPAIGPVRTDLRVRGAGIYLVRKGRTEGPVPMAEAAVALSRPLGDPVE